MQVIFTSDIIKRRVSAVVDDAATMKVLYTIAKVVLRKHGIRPVFYGLFMDGRIIVGDSTPAKTFIGPQGGPLYLHILIPKIVSAMLNKSLEEQFMILKNIPHTSDTGKNEPRGRHNGVNDIAIHNPITEHSDDSAGIPVQRAFKR